MLAALIFYRALPQIGFIGGSYMIINTKFFGDINIDEDKIILFEDGILGFPDYKKYLFMESGEDGSPFFWLQSIEDVGIVFPIIDVTKCIPDDSPVADSAEIDSLGNADDDLAIYNIIIIPKHDAKDMTVNLKAPVVINLNTMKAKQIISSNEEYPIKYYLYKELKKIKAGE